MSLSFIVREGFSGFGRAKMPAAITVTISFFALVLLGLFSTVSLSFFDIIQELRSRMELEVFLADSLTEAQAAGITGKIRELDGVRDAVYVTREEAASIFSRDFGEDVVGILGSNPLPRSVRLKFQPEYARPDSIAKVVPLISGLAPGLEVRYNQKYLGQIEQNGKLFTLLTGGMGLLIAVATVVLIGYTIRLALYSRQEKIRTMRLVGATAWFIGAPYVIEGALQGILSGLLAAGAVYVVFEQLLFTYEPAMYEILHPSALLIYPSLVLLGLALGIFGSTLSVGKYLRAASKR
ncbi:cell division protein FtsX [Chlorobium sp.]|jgi:cell division transport system permease protein|uniref:cell division protein FtsX n=1 Tax=Chlorobium sp. TaxID=1095 RepID=UPI003C313B93